MKTSNMKEYQKEYQKNYRMVNKEKHNNNAKEYYKTNKETAQKKSKEYRELNKETIQKKSKEYRESNKKILKKNKQLWYQKNKDKVKSRVAEYQKLRKSKDPVFKLKANIRTMISNILGNRGFTKKSSTFDIVGCSYCEFINNIESQFESWMDWDNYGKYNGELNYGWDIDHVVPISSAKTEEDVLKLNHYTNLRPLCSKVNRDIKIDN